MNLKDVLNAEFLSQPLNEEILIGRNPYLKYFKIGEQHFGSGYYTDETGSVDDSGTVKIIKNEDFVIAMQQYDRTYRIMMNNKNPVIGDLKNKKKDFYLTEFAIKKYGL